MKKYILFLCIAVITNTFSQTTVFDALLQKHVDDLGNVNYASFLKDKETLADYLSDVSTRHPDTSWPAAKEKAFWINAYNAYTIKIILDNYPLKSITHIKRKGKTAWKMPLVRVGGKTYTLDHIEHEILRKKFKDPRIHVGVNCASVSCPKLANFAFTEENIDAELERLMKDFINDPSRNKISSKKIEISEIFNWFKEDFIAEGTVIDYLNKYSDTTIDRKAKIKYLSYDWGLNEK